MGGFSHVALGPFKVESDINGILPASLLLMVEGRSAEALAAFAKALREHGGDPSQIEAIAMDMSPAYVKGASEHFPQARIVFDKFHFIVLAGKAPDEVRGR